MRGTTKPIVEAAFRRFGGTRPILSNTYYPALSQGNVDVVTEGIQRVDGGAIVCRNGARHEVDTIITAIGYRDRRSLLVNRVVRRGGRTLGPKSIGINSVIRSSRRSRT